MGCGGRRRWGERREVRVEPVENDVALEEKMMMMSFHLKLILYYSFKNKIKTGACSRHWSLTKVAPCPGRPGRPLRPSLMLPQSVSCPRGHPHTSEHPSQLQLGLSVSRTGVQPCIQAHPQKVQPSRNRKTDATHQGDTP